MSTLLLGGVGVRAAGGQAGTGSRGARRIAASSKANSSRGMAPARADAHAGGRLTLGQRLDGVWEGLRAGEAVSCPVCREELRLCGDQDATGRCGGCGSVLD